jgi:hypothetical protein
MLPPEDREPGTQPNGLPWPSGSPQAEAAGSAGNDSLKAIGVVDASNEKYDGVEVLSYTLNKEFTVEKSLLTINTDQSDNTVSIISKDSGMSTTGSYYAFGTTMFFKPTLEDLKQNAGIGFFLSGEGSTGYYVQIRTTSTAAAQGGNEFKFLKIKNGNMTALEDSQGVSDAAKLTAVYSGSSYKIDVYVKVSANRVDLIGYVNGFKITASDTGTKYGNTTTPKLSTTSNIGLYARRGTVAFDYVYAIPITKDQYDSAELFNVYKRQFANTAVTTSYGDVFISGLEKVEQNSNGYIEEFGPVAREIRSIKIRYDAAPAYPKYPTTGVNQAVSIVASNLSTFTGEVYVLNNAGTYIPLDDSAGTSFAIIGNSVIQSSPLTYTEDPTDPYSPTEPVSFDSQWIQRADDAKNLYDWIVNQWKNKQMVIKVDTFANPLISVGDVISAKHEYLGVTDNIKFVVTNVNQSWGDGLSTQIVARSIYS